MGKPKPKKPGYWDNIKNIQKHLKKIVKKNKGKFPTKQELRQFPYGMEIEVAIMRLGMTPDEFRMQMGIKAPDADERDEMLDLLMSSTDSFLDTVRDKKKSMGIEPIDTGPPEQVQWKIGGQQAPTSAPASPPASPPASQPERNVPFQERPDTLFPEKSKKTTELKDTMASFEQDLKKFREKEKE